MRGKYSKRVYDITNIVRYTCNSASCVNLKNENMKNQKTTNVEMIGEILGVVFQEKYVYRSILQSLEIDVGRMQILHNIFQELDRMCYEEMQAKAYLYGSLIKDGNLLARCTFLCLLDLTEAKRLQKTQDLKGEE